MSHLIRRVSSLLVLCVLASAALAPVRAVDTDGILVPGDPNDFVLLSSLIGQRITPSVTVGDKVFSMFTYTPTGDMPAAVDVNVFGFEDPNGHFGVTLHGAFLDLPGGAPASSAALQFLVNVTAEGEQEGFRISDAHLYLNGAGIDNNPTGSIVSVDESFAEASETLRVALSNLPSSAENIFSDSVIFGQTYQALHTNVVIFASAGEGAIQPARTTAIDLAFSQIVIPEPAAGLLMIAGCGSLFLGRRRI